MREHYFSKNNWIAQIESDKVIYDPVYHNKGKFVILCWNAKGRRGCYPGVFDSPEEAYKLLVDLDSQAVTVTSRFGLEVTVFIDAQKEWWSYKVGQFMSYQPFIVVKSLQEAIEIVSWWGSPAVVQDDNSLPF